MGKSTEKIGQQDFTTNFSLRSGDESNLLAESFKEMNRGLKDRFDRMKLYANKVDSASENLLQRYSAGKEGRSFDMEPEKKAVAELAADVEALKDELSKFKT